MGADVYWSNDTTKYTTLTDGTVWAHAPTPEQERAEAQLMTVYADDGAGSYSAPYMAMVCSGEIV